VQSADDVVNYAVFVALKALGQFCVADVDAECYSNALANKGLDARDDGRHGELVVVIVRCACEKAIVDGKEVAILQFEQMQHLLYLWAN